MKKFTYMALWLLGIMWILSVWVVNAECNEWEEYIESEGRCYPSRAIIRDSITNDIIQLNDQEWNDLELYFLINTETLPHHYTMMDRNMGASEVYNQNWDNPNTESYWYVYQRWNNYWFTSTAESEFRESMTGVKTPRFARSGVRVPSLYANDVRYWGEDSWMWSWTDNDNIWWWRWDKYSENGAWSYIDRQWPCPDGYYVPSIDDWSDLRVDWFSYRITSSVRSDLTSDFLLPPAGKRQNDSYWKHIAVDVSKGWSYWTSSPDTDTSAYILRFSTGDWVGADTLPSRSRSIGASLRCFKNDFQSGWTLKFYLNWWKNGVIAVNSGKFTSMSSPSRDNSIFEGWYTTSDFQTWTKVWVWSGTEGVIDLYAKWWCFTWYVLSGDACVRWTLVTFYTGWWVPQPLSITVPYWTVLEFSWEVVKSSNWMTVTITWVADSYPWETFVWWSTGNSNRPKRIESLVTQDGEDNIYLYAIFRGDFTIRFNATANWWETDTGSISVPYGTLINLSEYTATKGSWWVRKFLWRNTNSGATSGFPNMYKAENEDSNDTTLYAIFRKDKFNINFETNGHGDTPSPQTINRWDNIVNPWNLTDPWYNFEWWSDNEYLTTNFDFWISPTDDVTLYAKWRAPWAECYEWFEYDDNLRMCIKKNEWVIRVWLGWGIILSSWYSDFLEDIVSLLITWDYKSKMWNFDVAKNYYWIMLTRNNDNKFMRVNGSLSSSWNIVEVFDEPRDKWNLLFKMITKASCRWEEPNCKFYNQKIEVTEWIPERHNLKLVVPDGVKQQFGSSLPWAVRADNVRIIFDPRVVVTFDSNWHWVSPDRQFLKKWSKIINPWSLSAKWYNFVGWSDDEYLISTFDFNNTVVNKDTTLYAKWESIWWSYSCPEWQEYDKSVGLCKKPADWVIRIWYQWDVEFSSWYSSFLDEVILKEANLSEIDWTEVEAFKKAFWILAAASDIFDWTDKIILSDTGIVENGNFWLLDYCNKEWKLLFTVVVDMEWSEFSSWWISIHTRFTYVNVASNVSSLDNLKLVPSSTGINEYVETYPPIAQLNNLWIIFSDRMEPNIIDNWWTHYSGWWWHHQRWTNENDKVDEHFSAESQDDNQDNSDEFQQAYEFAYKNWITTMDTIDKADMEGPLTRIAMAKMLSNYAINILGKKPANVVVPNFKDITPELNDEYDFWVSLAYQLGIMWINMPDNKFRPFDYVTRAEFATALSRMLYSTPDWDPYYVTHIEKLKAEWIITNDDPDMQELRWYVMIMLMRRAKN